MVDLNPTYAICYPAMHESKNGNLHFQFMHQLCISALNQILKYSSDMLQLAQWLGALPGISKALQFSVQLQGSLMTYKGPKETVYSTDGMQIAKHFDIDKYMDSR